jgi:hypothetical protein
MNDRVTVEHYRLDKDVRYGLAYGVGNASITSTVTEIDEKITLRLKRRD